MPTLPPDGENICELMPITSPSMLKSGPPELPLLMGASVWMKSSYGPALMLRLRAETMPAVTVEPMPKGSPMAITQSPMRALSLSPNLVAGSGFFGFTFSSARSVLMSRPTSLAGRVVSSLSTTLICSPFSITWLLVTM